MDNGTMVEAFKYLKYCQLAKNSLVSKRFRNLIQTHRHNLALLYVDHIAMDSFQIYFAAIKVFNKKLSLEEYNEWIMRNNYSKQIPIESQVANEGSTQSITNAYGLAASAYYKDSSRCEWIDPTNIFSADVELNNENWPLFQHFVRLTTDPFIYIDHAHLTDGRTEHLAQITIVYNANNSTFISKTTVKNPSLGSKITCAVTDLLLSGRLN